MTPRTSTPWRLANGNDSFRCGDRLLQFGAHGVQRLGPGAAAQARPGSRRGLRSVGARLRRGCRLRRGAAPAAAARPPGPRAYRLGARHRLRRRGNDGRSVPLRSTGGFRLGIGGIEGCFSPGSSVILPLCRFRSSSRISLYFEALTASVAGLIAQDLRTQENQQVAFLPRAARAT